MGLSSTLSDAQSESLPLFLVILLANCINSLQSFLKGFLHSIGFTPSSRFDSDENINLLHTIGSGLAQLIVVSEQSCLNRVFRYKSENKSDKCVVCLCKLAEGEQVRKLACNHVFHKACLDGWLFDHLNCPLCRSSCVSEERLAAAERRVTGDLVTWFSMR